MHILAAMHDGRITFIIPWHSSGNSGDTLSQLVSGATLGKETLTESNDYTSTQTDKRKSTTSDAEKNPNPASEAPVALRETRDAIVKGKAGNMDPDTISNPYVRKLWDMFYLPTDQYTEKYNGESNEDSYGVHLSGDAAEQIFPYEYWDKCLDFVYSAL